MEFRFAHLADFATEGANGKLILVGIFDSLLAGPQWPVVLPPMYLAAQFEAQVTEGTQHRLVAHLVDEDGHDLMPPTPEIPLGFVPQGPRRPLRGRVIMNLVGLRVPRTGTYEFHLFVDGHIMAQLSFYVIEAVDGKPLPPNRQSR